MPNLTVKQRLDRHGHEVVAIWKLILTGMKLIDQMGRRFDQRMEASEKRMDRLEKDLAVLHNEVAALVASMRGRNGHFKRSIQ